MPVPQVSIAWCRRSTECDECKRMIDVANPEVREFYWNKGKEGNRSFNVKRYYHPSCWLAKGLDYLERNPYSPGENKRGPKVDLSPEDRRKRHLLLREYAVYQHRKRHLVGDVATKALSEIRLDCQIASVIMAIGKVGGVPKRWIENLVR